MQACVIIIILITSASITKGMPQIGKEEKIMHNTLSFFC